MKKCFVISPFGPEGSETRRNSDDLYELIIQPALEVFDFDVVRGDKLYSVTAITEDIINHVQNSELCIIDLTGNNPNVYYECGRRHETAKPFIHVKRIGEQIPFDIAGIRTIDYDLSDGRKIKNSIVTLRKFIQELENSGYGSQSSSFSLNDIATTLSRIERKMDNIGSSQPVTTSETGSAIQGNPARVFYDAYAKGDYKLAVQGLKRFMKINHEPDLHLDLAALLVEAYEPDSVGILKNILDKDFDSLKSTMIATALHSLYLFSTAALTIKDDYEYIKGLTDKALKRKMSDKDKARFMNVLANIEYGIKDDLKALEFQKKTIELDPAEPAYHYNVATIYDSLKMTEELLKSLNMLITVYKSKDPLKDKFEISYLEYAKRKFSENKKMDKVAEIDEIIETSRMSSANKPKIDAGIYQF